MKKILIAVDDSPIAEKVASKGFEFCKQLQAEVALISVVDTAFLMTDGGVTPGELAKSIKDDLKKRQELLINEIFKEKKIWTFVEEGKPYETILKTADEWEADMIILGTHGRTGLSHLLLGSVAEKIVRNSTKPLLIIPVK